MTNIEQTRAAASAPKAELTDERAAFEAWAKRTHTRPGTHFRQSHNGVYTDNRIAAKWAAWKARAVLAQAAPVAVPDGWKLVPVEPTEIMYIRGEEEMTHGYDLEDDTTAGARDRAELIGSIYKAMLAAAPAAPVAAAVPAGWVKNEGWEPLIEAELRDGTLVAQEASAYAWEIDGEHEPGDIIRCRVSFTAKRGFTDPAPAQETGDAS